MIERRQFLTGLFGAVALSGAATTYFYFNPVAEPAKEPAPEPQDVSADAVKVEMEEDLALEESPVLSSPNPVENFKDIGPQGALAKGDRLQMPERIAGGKAARIPQSVVETKPAIAEKPVAGQDIATVEEPDLIPKPVPRPDYTPPESKKPQRHRQVAKETADAKPAPQADVKKKKIVTAEKPVIETKPKFELKTPSIFRRAPSGIVFLNSHTSEKMSLDFRDIDRKAVDYFMRDFRENEIKHVANSLIPHFGRVVQALRSGGVDADTWELISGFRTRKTNAMLQGSRGGQATHSLHIEAKAMDIRARGVRLSAVHEAALRVSKAEGVGGVGYYPNAKSNFVHIDVGRQRIW